MFYLIVSICYVFWLEIIICKDTLFFRFYKMFFPSLQLFSFFSRFSMSAFAKISKKILTFEKRNKPFCRGENLVKWFVHSFL